MMAALRGGQTEAAGDGSGHAEVGSRGFGAVTASQLGVPQRGTPMGPAQPHVSAPLGACSGHFLGEKKAVRAPAISPEQQAWPAPVAAQQHPLH